MRPSNAGQERHGDSLVAVGALNGGGGATKAYRGGGATDKKLYRGTDVRHFGEGCELGRGQAGCFRKRWHGGVESKTSKVGIGLRLMQKQKVFANSKSM